MDIKDGMYSTFITKHDYEGQPRSVITTETDAEALDEILEEFESHLRGAGFLFNGHLEVVPNE